MKFSVITPTHDTRWLGEAWQSLRCQTHDDFKWIVLVNDKSGNPTRVREREAEVLRLVEGDSRVEITTDFTPFVGVGARKRAAFGLGTGEALVELDHDDVLVPETLAELAIAFADPKVGFVYSDNIDFTEDGSLVTYRNPEVRQGWLNNGFTFYEADVGGPRAGRYEAAHAFPVTALSISLIFWAPNHVRAWRRSVYEAVGGHDPTLGLCDDQELMLRTFHATTMRHIPKPLYLYRVSGENTWAKSADKIRTLTFELQAKHFQDLGRAVLRECTEAGMPAVDLGGAFDAPLGWTPVDKDEESMRRLGGLAADLTKPWPFRDNSIGAFRAWDFLEHLPDKQHTMREIHRCLRPGGWLLSYTPSADGRGAWMDPTHCSPWNEPAFWYWTRDMQAKYIRNADVRFQEIQLVTEFPSDWHKTWNIPYVRASLMALKPGYKGPLV